MTTYYNENDAYAAQWLRNLIAEGLIAPGDVDERSIADVRAADLDGYTQCHFFAGIGGWPIALDLAGWPADQPVWTGSCPCQPFSSAGQGKAADDERHLWPSWLPLIAERRPPVIFGEQVEAAIGWGWIDAVFADLEAEGYACGATVLPACGVGAPHVRQRIWFVAESPGEGRSARAEWAAGADGRPEAQPGRLRDPSGLEHSERRGGCAVRFTGLPEGEGAPRGQGGEQADRLARPSPSSKLADAEHERCAGREPARSPSAPKGLSAEADERRAAWLWQSAGRGAAHAGWAHLIWLPCTDGKARPTQPGLFPLAHGIQRRPSKLRALGNAIVPQIAAEFIAAYRECQP